MRYPKHLIDYKKHVDLDTVFDLKPNSVEVRIGHNSTPLRIWLDTIRILLLRLPWHGSRKRGFLNES